MDSEDIKQFCHSLPKVELHAHLNTSYSRECLKELLAISGNQHDTTDELCISSNREIDDSFILFTKIQQLVTTEETVYLLAKMVITEFAEDNVKYLELRSTPKQIEATGMTRELYLRTMIRAVQDCEKDGLDIIVRLLPSIDRRLGVEVAQITVDLSHKLMKEYNGIILGIDFSGDPRVGNAEDYIPVFQDAVKKGLKLALHLAEIPLYEETKKVLKSCATNGEAIRIGHGTFLHRYEPGLGHEEIENLVINHRIPVEACLTSNIRTKTVDSFEENQFKYWLEKRHPVVLCTDGKGAYGSTLTEEYTKAAEAFKFSKQDLKNISMDSINCIFETEDVKNRLKQKFDIEMNLKPDQ